MFLKVSTDFNCNYLLLLDSKIDLLKWSSDGKFVAVTDISGSLHIISQNFKPIFSEKILTPSQLDDAADMHCFHSIGFTCRNGMPEFTFSIAANWYDLWWF